MKKLFAIFLTLILMAAAAGCAEKTQSTTGDNTEKITQTTQQEEKQETDTNGYQPDPSLPGVVSINVDTVKYCVDAPSENIHSRGSMYVNMDSYFVSYHQYMDPGSKLLFNVDISEIKEVTDVIEGMSEQFIDACKEGLIDAADYKFTLTKNEKVEINGYDMARFEGEFELLYEIENPAVDYTSTTFVGYSVIKDGCPVFFVVVDIPSVGGVDDIGTVADKIAKTFREYSED